MSIPSLYSTGTLSVANGDTAVTGNGTAWSSQIKYGTLFFVRASLGGSPELFEWRVLGAAGSTTIADAAFTLAAAWEGDDLVDATYFALTGNDGGDIATSVRTLMDRLIGRGLGVVSAGTPVATAYQNNDLVFVRDGNYLAIKDQGILKAVATVLSAFGTVVFGDVTNSPSDRDLYDDGQGDLAAAPDRLLFFSRTEGGFYELITPDTGSGATWSDLVVVRGVTASEVLDELGIHSITVSTDPPSGGVDGDLWFQVGA